MADEESSSSKETTLDPNKINNSGPNPHNTIFHTVIHLVDDNILHFHEDESEQGQRLYSGLRALRDGLLRVADVEETIRKEAAEYDFRLKFILYF